MVGPGQPYAEMITGEFIASRERPETQTPVSSEAF
jgi:hypothetical protein